MDGRLIASRRSSRATVARRFWLTAALMLVGCSSSSQWVDLRSAPHNPLAEKLQVLSPKGPQPTERTLQLLRRYNLADRLSEDRPGLLAQIEEIERQEPNRENHYAIAELAYLDAKKQEKTKPQAALEMYGTALLHAYDYLFADASAPPDNPFDPHFRGACDLYNQSLEGALRIVRGQGEFHPGDKRTMKTASQLCQFDVQLFSTGWHPEDFDRFEFVSDYQVNGLRNHYHTYGLGVPLIAIRRQYEGQGAAEKFYPPSLAFPITAFLRVDKSPHVSNAAGRMEASHGAPRLVLELHDPLDRQQLAVNNRLVPLESDLSTPLAYFLNQPHFQDSKLSTEGLLRPDSTKRLQGLYMLEPYDPHKMPVVMVHGLWSSPVTWMEMYNDLRSDPQVREHYQFWFYLYPTGQPFWTSAAQMRSELASLRATVDPRLEHPAIDQMVLVGHSMGGLVSKLQTIDSGDAFWAQVSERPLKELNAPSETKQTLAATYFFAPNPSVRNVITIGTPHRGSPFSNDLTRWLGNKLISAPMSMLQMSQQLLANNGDALRPNSPLLVRTSIDSLAPDSPLLPVLLTAEPGPWVEYHNIVGRVPNPGIRGYFAGDGDGVVNFESARLDEMANLRSQVIVPADHMNIHRHPQSILEVRRILMDQVRELENFGNTDIRVAGAEDSEAASVNR